MSISAPTTGVRADATGFSLHAVDGTAYRVELTMDLFAPGNLLLRDRLAGRRVVAFVGPTVNRLYGERIRAYLRDRLSPGSWTVHVVRTGERFKTLASVERIGALAKADGLDRHGVMLAVGGGVLCDLVGFAAATYARGVRYVKVNTTLVGQVDVGVGIKTGVNAFGSKNMLGAYHPAYASINDPAFLRTLPDREIRCGLGEIVKMAVIRDRALFETLVEHPDAFRPAPDRVGPPGPEGMPDRVGPPRPDGAVGGPAGVEDYVLRAAMESMLRELCPNLREENLARLVDFGHTFGPVIETASDYRVAHGESVAIDMALSSQIARLLGLLSEADCDRITELLLRLGLPVYDAATCTPELMWQALRGAWERRGRRLHLVVPTGIGSATFVDDLDDLPAGVLDKALVALAAAGRAGRPGRLVVAG
ncbi:sedoheptulose 7-phosphate cyclase [Polymorphospora lycopeni]|uniref:2-epi-5-epi-valiolone synthase n=1 Tax=Polymorphospora lycopeni TaxID=3140240 RepID=A0ABV5CUJ7_9ACTN